MHSTGVKNKTFTFYTKIKHFGYMNSDHQQTPAYGDDAVVFQGKNYYYKVVIN